jgi:hypothetical protein
MGNQILEARRVPKYTPKPGDRNSVSIPLPFHFEEQRLVFSRFEGRSERTYAQLGLERL